MKLMPTNNKMYCKTVLCKSSSILCAAAIAGCKGSLQYVGGKKQKWMLQGPLLYSFLMDI